jgi:hypothetical protein
LVNPGIKATAGMRSTKFTRIRTRVERFGLRRGTAYTRGNIPSVRVTNIL